MTCILTTKIGKLFRLCLIGAIQLYRYCFSPFLPISCCYYPTCSSYACQALKNKPLYEASILICKRLVRCNPFSGGGYDPLPDKKVKPDQLQLPNFRKGLAGDEK
jgi:putative membrane protein insertion efficiency factor